MQPPSEAGGDGRLDRTPSDAPRSGRVRRKSTPWWQANGGSGVPVNKFALDSVWSGFEATQQTAGKSKHSSGGGHQDQGASLRRASFMSPASATAGDHMVAPATGTLRAEILGHRASYSRTEALANLSPPRMVAPATWSSGRAGRHASGAQAILSPLCMAVPATGSPLRADHASGTLANVSPPVRMAAVPSKRSPTMSPMSPAKALLPAPKSSARTSGSSDTYHTAAPGSGGGGSSKAPRSHSKQNARTSPEPAIEPEEEQAADPFAAGRPRRATAEMALRRLKGDRGVAPPDLFLRRAPLPGPLDVPGAEAVADHALKPVVKGKRPACRACVATGGEALILLGTAAEKASSPLLAITDPASPLSGLERLPAAASRSAKEADGGYASAGRIKRRAVLAAAEAGCTPRRRKGRAAEASGAALSLDETDALAGRPAPPMPVSSSRKQPAPLPTAPPVPADLPADTAPPPQKQRRPKGAAAEPSLLPSSSPGLLRPKDKAVAEEQPLKQSKLGASGSPLQPSGPSVPPPEQQPGARSLPLHEPLALPRRIAKEEAEAQGAAVGKKRSRSAGVSPAAGELAVQAASPWKALMATSGQPGSAAAPVSRLEDEFGGVADFVACSEDEGDAADAEALDPDLDSETDPEQPSGPVPASGGRPARHRAATTGERVVVAPAAASVDARPLDAHLHGTPAASSGRSLAASPARSPHKRRTSGCPPASPPPACSPTDSALSSPARSPAGSPAGAGMNRHPARSSPRLRDTSACLGPSSPRLSASPASRAAPSARPHQPGSSSQDAQLAGASAGPPLPAALRFSKLAAGSPGLPVGGRPAQGPAAAASKPQSQQRQQASLRGRLYHGTQDTIAALKSRQWLRDYADRGRDEFEFYREDEESSLLYPEQHAYPDQQEEAGQWKDPSRGPAATSSGLCDPGGDVEGPLMEPARGEEQPEEHCLPPSSCYAAAAAPAAAAVPERPPPQAEERPLAPGGPAGRAAVGPSTGSGPLRDAQGFAVPSPRVLQRAAPVQPTGRALPPAGSSLYAAPPPRQKKLRQAPASSQRDGCRTAEEEEDAAAPANVLGSVALCGSRPHRTPAGRDAASVASSTVVPEAAGGAAVAAVLLPPTAALRGGGTAAAAAATPLRSRPDGGLPAAWGGGRDAPASPGPQSAAGQLGSAAAASKEKQLPMAPPPPRSAASTATSSGGPAGSGAASGRPSRPDLTPAELLLERIFRENAKKKIRRVEDDWTPEEETALHTAYFRTEPTHPYFWQEVAKRVRGRSAGECFAKVHDRRLPHEVRARFRGLHRMPDPTPPPVPKTAPAPMKKPSEAARRKWARDRQIQAQLQRLTQPGNIIDRAALQRSNPELAEALVVKEHADKYIGAFLRKAGGWSKWQRTCKQGQERRQKGAVAAAGAARSRPPLDRQERVTRAVKKLLEEDDELLPGEDDGESGDESGRRRRRRRDGEDDDDDDEAGPDNDFGEMDDNYLWEIEAAEDDAGCMDRLAQEAGMNEDLW